MNSTPAPLKHMYNIVTCCDKIWINLYETGTKTTMDCLAFPNDFRKTKLFIYRVLPKK